MWSSALAEGMGSGWNIHLGNQQQCRTGAWRPLPSYTTGVDRNVAPLLVVAEYSLREARKCSSCAAHAVVCSTDNQARQRQGCSGRPQPQHAQRVAAHLEEDV